MAAAPPVIFDALAELRAEIEEVAADGSASVEERNARLLEFRNDLTDLLGSIDTYLGDNRIEQSAEQEPLAVARLYENAEIRERLIESGRATADDCDALMLYPVEELDYLAEEGLLEETALHVASFMSALHKFDPAKHPRGRGGRFSEVLGRLAKASEGDSQDFRRGVSVKKVGNEFHVQHRGGVVHKTRNLEDAARVVTTREQMPSTPRHRREPPVESRTASRAIKAGTRVKITSGPHRGKTGVVKTRSADGSTVIDGEDGKTYRAHEDALRFVEPKGSETSHTGDWIRSRAGGASKQERQRAQAAHEQVAAERDLPEDERKRLYQERRAELEKRAAASVASAAERGKLTDAEAHFNQAGKVSQRTLSTYVEEAGTRPQTIDLYSRIDPHTGQRVWDESRRQLHERIITAYLKKRKIDPATGKPVLDYSPTAEDLAPHPDGPQVLFSGGGYAPLALDTPVATPSGWSTMGALEEGDYVFDVDGRQVCVEGVSSVLTGRRCYEIEFDDGTRIVADAEHKWLTSTFASRKSAGRAAVPERAHAMGLARVMRDSGAVLREIAEALEVSIPTAARWGGREQIRLGSDVRTTAEIAETVSVSPGAQGSKANHAIENGAPLVLAEAILPIDPYTLGAWLGDGTTTAHTLTCTDEEIVWQIRAAGYEVEPGGLSGGGCPRWKIKPLWRPLREHGLLGNKHIPTVYLRASEGQRRALLAGLLDTDGSVVKSGGVEFYTTLPALRDGVAELLASLGIKFSVREKRARLNGVDHGPCWTLAFTTDQPVFRLRRKRELQRVVTGKRAGKWARRYIVAVREVASVPTRCIAVASQSHLFLAGESMVPTHNSGKGSVLKLLAARGEMPPDSFVLDPDQVKAELPEYQAGVATDPESNMLTYRESWAIAQEIQARAMERKLNIVVDGISNTSPEEMGQRARAFTSRGYQARAVYVDIPTEEAMKRAESRAVNAKDESDRRMIPAVIMRSVHRDVAATVPALPGYLADHQIPLKLEVWSNHEGVDENGQFRPPIPFFSYKDGKRSVLDQSRWDAFVAKGHEPLPGIGH